MFIDRRENRLCGIIRSVRCPYTKSNSNLLLQSSTLGHDWRSENRQSCPVLSLSLSLSCPVLSLSVSLVPLYRLVRLCRRVGSDPDSATHAKYKTVTGIIWVYEGTYYGCMKGQNARSVMKQTYLSWLHKCSNVCNGNCGSAVVLRIFFCQTTSTTQDITGSPRVVTVASEGTWVVTQL